MSHASVLVALEGKQVNQLGLEKALEEQMAPFDENGECFRDGSRWDWYQIGGRFSGKFLGKDVITVKDLDLPRLLQFKRERLIENWKEAEKEKSFNDPKMKELIYGIKPGETMEKYLERELDGVAFPASYAFLRELHWHEGKRMGWWGVPSNTECEIKAKQSGNTSVEEMIRRCKHRDPVSGAVVVCWNEPDEVWAKEFYHRFIEPLPPSAVLVNVDYHV